MPEQIKPIVEVEEEVYSFTNADNGAGPMWCHGNTSIVRIGDRLFVSGLQTLEGYVPLNNVRLNVYTRADGDSGWQHIYDGDDTHEREGSPIACFQDGRVFVTSNPNASAPEEYDGTATPTIYQFSAADPSGGHETLFPKWDREIAFHGHTYRSFVADSANREFVLLYNTAYDCSYISFYSDGKWLAQATLDFPWGAEYDKPQPIRVCYPNVALKNRAVYFCGVSDIVEPYNEWRAYKKEITGRDWDYDFRRLFFTWSDDITTGEFHKWMEISSRDRTCGWMSPTDMYVADDGNVHIMWTEKSLDERLREKFFPLEKQTYSLHYAIIRNGVVRLQRALMVSGEGECGEQGNAARFQVTEDGRLLAIIHVGGKDACGNDMNQNRIIQIFPDGTVSEPVILPLQVPLGSFYTATTRGGSLPSNTLDIFGQYGKDDHHAMRYARVRLV